MRAFLLCLFAVAEVLAQQKNLTFEQVTGGAFSGFSDDEKAEKVWEATAKFMKPTAESGLWDLEGLRVQSFRSGQPQATFTSPSGRMSPTKRSAQGSASMVAESAAFHLTGDGWSWRSTPKGDSFAVLANVSADLDLAKPAARRMKVRARRLDASPAEGGTLLVFQGEVVLTRAGERTTCERVECLLDDGPQGDTQCKSIIATGKVVRTDGVRTLRGETATFDLREEVYGMLGQVEMEEPGFRGTAHRLRHAVRTDVTELFALEGQKVKLHLERKPAEKADVAGWHVVLRRESKLGVASVEVSEDASYASERASLRARLLTAVEKADGRFVLTAEGDARGRIEGADFAAGKMRWDDATGVLDLEQSPRLRDANGIESAGHTIRTNRLSGRMEIRSAPGVRAAVRLPAEEGGKPGLAEADQVVVVAEDDALQLAMLGHVHYVSGPVVTDSDQFVAFALPRTKGRKDYALSKAILTGDVKYAQPGLRCSAARIDLSPAVEIEEVLRQDALAGRPRLLTLSGGQGESRPRLFVTYSDGRSAEFIADAHEVLATPTLTKFFLRGNVGMMSDDTLASCDLLEGLASPDKAGRQVARQVVGRGNVKVVAGGSTAVGRTLEVSPDKGEARLFGDARVRDRSGNEGRPAKELRYDFRQKSWRMESAESDTVPGQVVRPKIFLGRDFTLPEVKNLDKGR